MSRNSPNSYENFFSEPQLFNDGYGYTLAAWNTPEHIALKKFIEYFDDWHWITEDKKRYLIAELKSNMKLCWTRWQGYQDDDGIFKNGWVVVDKWPGLGSKRWKPVWSTNYSKHYLDHGHHFEGRVDSQGYKSWNRCGTCINTDVAEINAKIKELSHIEEIPEAQPYLRFWWGEKSKERDIAMTVKERIEELEKQKKYYDL